MIYIYKDENIYRDRVYSHAENYDYLEDDFTIIELIKEEFTLIEEPEKNIAGMNLLEIIKFYGYKSQIRKLAEEQYEVIEALFEESREHIKEEIADNIHLLGQFAEYYNITTDEIMEMVKQKNERTLNIINGEK